MNMKLWLMDSCAFCIFTWIPFTLICFCAFLTDSALLMKNCSRLAALSCSVMSHFGDFGYSVYIGFSLGFTLIGFVSSISFFTTLI
jgi:hypothetical protein